MKKNIRNVILTFSLVAVTAYGGSLFYKKQSAEAVLLASKVQTVKMQTDKQLQAISAERRKKLAASAFAVELAEAKRQAGLLVSEQEAKNLAAQIKAQKAAEAEASRIAAQKAFEVAVAEAAARNNTRRSRAS